MAYTPATKLPDIQIIELEDQSFASSLNTTTTTVVFSKAILDYNGDVVTKEMIVKGLNKAGETENIYIPANGLSVDGKTATGVTRGVRLDGLDYTTGDSSLAKEFDSGDKVVCPVSAVLHTILLNVLYGNIASGGNGLIIGDETDTSPEIQWAKNGEVTGFLRLNQATNEVEFKDFGGSWKSINDSSVGNLLKVSSDDTTPGYLEDKQIAGANITKTILNEGGNEVIQWSASSQREGIVEHETYTPASWTGGGSPETNVALINDITDGSLRFNSDGVLYNIDGISFVGDITKADVASTLQDAINAVVPNAVTVDWSGTPIVITGSDTSVNSEMSGFTTSTGTVGTDLTTGTWLDLAAGSQTEKVLDPSADAGKVLLLKSDGGLSAKAVTAQDSVVEGEYVTIDSNGGFQTVTLDQTRVVDADYIESSTTPGSNTSVDVYTYNIPPDTITNKKLSVEIYLSEYDNQASTIELDFGGSNFSLTEAVGGTNHRLRILIDIFDNGSNEQIIAVTQLQTTTTVSTVGEHYIDYFSATEDTSSSITLNLNVPVSSGRTLVFTYGVSTLTV